MRILFITILCVLLVGCANKSRQQAAGNAPIPAKDSIYHLPDQYPEYPGGMKKLMEQIENSIQYPEGARKKGVEGRVIVQFFVDEKGKVIEPQVLKSVEPSLNKEALRIVSMLPTWKPGTWKGKPVKVKYTMPVLFKLEETEPKKKEDSTVSEPAILGLQPMPKDIPSGKRMNPDSLSMTTEFAYYPLSATQVNVFIHNHSHRMYTCGDEYSLAFYNESLQKWEPLPTNPIIEDILWMLHPDYHPYRLQTIELYTSEIPNRPGNYRIYKTFNGGEVAYAEFELVDRKGVKRLRKLIDDYWDKNSANPCDTVAHNISTTWIVHDDGDTIFVGLMNNTPRYQEMFRRKVVSYSAVSHGMVVENVVFDKPSFSDTLQVTMQTEKAVYPVGTETITVQLTNENPKSLFFGEDYWIVRKEGQQWIYLHDNGSWTDIGYGLEKGHTRTFTARLRPLVNDNRPGTYRIIKEIGFFDSRQDWYMAAEFRIE